VLQGTESIRRADCCGSWRGPGSYKQQRHGLELEAEAAFRGIEAVCFFSFLAFSFSFLLAFLSSWTAVPPALPPASGLEWQRWKATSCLSSLKIHPISHRIVVMGIHSPPNCKENAERNVEILGGGPANFLASVHRGGAASAEIASWCAAGCPVIGAGRADMWRSRAVCRLRAQAGRAGARARVKPSESAGGRPVFGYGIWALGYSLHVYFAHHLMHCRLRSIVFLGHNV
jgi:hypothetical protein